MKHRRLATLAIIAPLLIAATACSAESNAPEVASVKPVGEAPTTPSTEDNTLKFAQCMREKGVEVDDSGAPPTDASGASSIGPEYIEANEECLALYPGKPIVHDPADTQAANQELAQCMRDNGVTDWPDPLAPGQEPKNTGSGGMVSSDGGGFDLPASIDLGSPSVKAALEKCMGGAGIATSGSAGMEE